MKCTTEEEKMGNKKDVWQGSYNTELAQERLPRKL